MRVFLGTFLEPEYVAHLPFAEVRGLFDTKLKPIKKESIHLTWLFMGEVDDRHIETLVDIINRDIDLFENLIFHTNKLTLWPPGRAPRLIVVDGVLNKDISLHKIGMDMKEVCSPELKKTFLPHITVARFKKHASVNRRLALPPIKHFMWKIQKVELIKSTLQSTGPIYESIRSWNI